MEFKLRKGLIFFVVLLMLCTSVFAATVSTPEGPTNTYNTSSRRTVSTALQNSVVAGNVMIMNLNGNTVTQTWAALVGNITGTITLDDTGQNTIYDWALASPQGEIFATQGASTSWTSVECYNFTQYSASNNKAGAAWLYFNDTAIERVTAGGSCASKDTAGGIYCTLEGNKTYPAFTGITYDDVDGLDETFNATYAFDDEYNMDFAYDLSKRNALNFSVANVTIDHYGACPMVNLYVADNDQISRSGCLSVPRDSFWVSSFKKSISRSI